MPKATRANDSATPKKRSRKAKPEPGNGTQVVEPVTTSPKLAQGSHPSPVLEEKIRTRAYELYLQRGGTGGSPEQDWLQAKTEICGEQPIA
ncbi:MAG TPA: DUF2934 domain-containing protein [Terriglobales bacterium]|nr:DUF2934 domain-containing protein [Terriglobales bacterium]